MSGEDNGLFGANVDEELQRCIFVLLFHIPVLSISVIICVFVVLLSLLCTFFFFFLYVYAMYLFSYSHVNRIMFVVTLK
jgi:hypothetical protein